MNILENAIKETLTMGEENPEKCFHIAMTGTPNYICRLGVLMYSILKNNPDMLFAFHVFTNELPDEEKEKMMELLRRFSCLIYIHLMDDSVFTPLIFGIKTPVFFYRFVVPEVVGKVSDRILYLDGDMVCRGSLRELQELDFKDALAAVVSDRSEKRQMGQMGTRRFFNAGMMLFHVKQWEKENMFNRVVEAALDALHHIDKKGRYDGWHGATYNDQNILNVLLDGRLIFLPKKFNYVYILTISAFMKKQPYNADYREQTIIHFAGSVKSWHSWVQDIPVVQEYTAWQKESPWRNVKLVEAKGHRDFHQLARKARKQEKWLEALKWYGAYFKHKL